MLGGLGLQPLCRSEVVVEGCLVACFHLVGRDGAVVDGECMQIAVEGRVAFEGCTYLNVSARAQDEHHVLLRHLLAVQVVAFHIAIVGHYPVLPFALVLLDEWRTAVLERCVVHHQSVLRVAAVAELDGGKVVAVGDELYDALVAIHLRIQHPCLYAVGCAVVHAVGQRFVAAERLRTREVEGRTAVVEFHENTCAREVIVVALQFAHGSAYGEVLGVQADDGCFGALAARSTACNISMALLPGRGDCRRHHLFIRGGILVHLHIPDATEVTIHLATGYPDAQVTGGLSARVDHRRTRLGVAGVVGIECPLLSVGGGFYFILIIERRELKLRLHLLEGGFLPEVYLQIIFTVTGGGSPKRSIVVVGGILWAVVVAVVARGCRGGTEGEVLTDGQVAH